MLKLIVIDGETKEYIGKIIKENPWSSYESGREFVISACLLWLLELNRSSIMTDSES